MKGLKIAIIGGGSSYTPEFIEGFIKRKDELPIKEIYGLLTLKMEKKSLKLLELWLKEW